MKAIKIPCEHDLLSTKPEVWAEAMVRCKHAGAFCGADGYCHYKGACFADQSLTREQAILEMDRLAQELYELKQENNQLAVLPQVITNQLEFALKQAMDKGHSEKVFAFRACINEINRVGARDKWSKKAQKLVGEKNG